MSTNFAHLKSRWSILNAKKQQLSLTNVKALGKQAFNVNLFKLFSCAKRREDKHIFPKLTFTS